MSIFYVKKTGTGYYAWSVFKYGQLNSVSENFSLCDAHREANKLFKKYYSDPPVLLAEIGEWWEILKAFELNDEWRLFDNRTTTKFVDNETTNICSDKNKWDSFMEKLKEAIRIDLRGDESD